MMNCKQENKTKTKIGAAFGIIAAGAAALILGLVAFPVPRIADALPAYATQTSLSCGQCHVRPGGGGALTGFGKAYASNGHKVPGGAAPSAAGIHSQSDTFFLDWPKRCNGWCPRHYD